MDIEKSKKLLAKIQALVDNLGDGESISSRLEKDLLLNYVKDLYVALQDNSTSKNLSIVDENITVDSGEMAGDETAEEVFHDEEAGQQAVDEPGEIPVETKEKESEKDDSDEAKNAEEIVYEGDSELKELFEIEEGSELMDKLSIQPIKKLEKAMGINERILTINELFGGDKDLFKHTLTHINEIGSYDAARDYLMQGVAKDLQWGQERKQKKAKHFIRIVKRKFTLK
jgi:hypothetical protein